MKLKNISKLVIIAFFCFYTCTYSETAKPTIKSLNLESLLSQAIENNPKLSANKPIIRAAELKAKRVRMPSDPKFKYSSKDNEHLFQQAYKRERRYGIAQKVPFPGKLRLKKEIQLEELELKITKETSAMQTLVLKIKKLYHQLYLNHFCLNLKKKNKEIASKVIANANRAKKTDLLEANINLEKLNNEIFGLEKKQRSLETKINAVLNLPQETTLGIPEKRFHSDITFSTQQIDRIEKLALNNRSDIIGQYAEIEKYKKKAKLARRNYFPDLDLEMIIQRKMDFCRYAWYVKLGFEIPIWARQKQKRESDENEAKALAKALELQNMRNTILSEIRTILSEIETVHKQVSSYKDKILPAHIEIVKLKKSEYESGKEKISKFVEAILKLQNAEIDLEKTLVERELLLATLEKEVGAPIESLI